MVFCPTCGAELAGDEKFCKFCGSEIGIPAATVKSPAPPVAPAPTATPQASAGTKARVPKKKMKKIGIVILVLLAISGASYGILVAATWGTYDQTVPFAYYASGADYDDITLNVDFDLSMADINLDYIDAVDGAPLVQGAYEQHLVGPMLGDYVFSKSQSGKTINLALSFALRLFFLSGYSRVNIQLLKNTTYTLVLATSTGNINVAIPSGTKDLNGITATVSTGNTKLVGNDMNVTGDVRASASTGNVNVTFTNVNVTGSIVTSTSTGNNAMTLTRSRVTGNTHSGASTGKVDVSFSDTHVGGNFEFSTSTGDLNMKLVNLTIDNDAPSFWANCSTGNLNVEFQQRVDLGGTMGTYLETSTGSINLYYKAINGLDTGFKGVGSASTGTVAMHPETGFSTRSGSTIQTDNYGSATSKINALTVKASTGNVDIYATSLS